MGTVIQDKDALRSELRKKLKRKYQEQEKEISLHKKTSVMIDAEIYELKLQLLEVDRDSMEEERDSINKPARPYSYRKSVGRCINPKCLKSIRIGQPAVKYGYYGLCCNWLCFSEALAAKT